jgi:hypothetical protein
MLDLRLSRFAVCIPIECCHGRLLAVFQTMTGGMVLIPQAVWLYDSNSRVIIAGDFSTDKLQEQGILVPENTDENAVAKSWMEQFHP